MGHLTLGIRLQVPYKQLVFLELGGEPMNLSHVDIRSLRQRLGWSQAEMARQMGCNTKLIQDWECGNQQPDPEAMNHLQYLSQHVENKSNQVSQTPLAEREMELRGVAQLTHGDLLKDFQ